MTSTYVREEAARRLRHGLSWVLRDEIVSVEGTPAAGEPVELRGPQGELLGVGDIDLSAPVAVRRLGLPREPLEGLLQRHLREAVRRRALWLEDVRYARLINEDGDGLPGLVIDRYDHHYVVQTLSRSMEARVEEIARTLKEVMGANSALLRNDTPLRARAGLELKKPHVLFGSPPRWARVLELGARLTFDLAMGPNGGYPYEQRELGRLIGRISHGTRVLNVACGVGGLFVHAGRAGAKQILASEADPEQADLARENAEANALMSRVKLQTSTPRQLLEECQSKFDLVLFRIPDESGRTDEDALWLMRLAVRATRHAGRLLIACGAESLKAPLFENQLALACELEARVGHVLARPGMPADFPALLGAPNPAALQAIAVELS